MIPLSNKCLCVTFRSVCIVCPPGLNPAAVVMSRQTLSRHLIAKRNQLSCDLKSTFTAIQYVCITADAWSTCNKGFLGITAHWISEDTLQRHSAALSCGRLKGYHTYDVIAEALSDVLSAYGLSASSGKVVCCITDNGSNFTKAFCEFGMNFGDSFTPVDEILRPGLAVANAETSLGDDDFVESDDNDSDMLQFDSLNETLDEINKSCELSLPPHHPCASHTLSLLAVSDLQSAFRENAMFKKLHNATMAKCSAIWNNTSRSLKCSKAIEQIAGRRLVKPCPTPWNSLYDSLVVLQSLRADLKAICLAVGVPAFKDSELEFITEYVMVLSPVAAALDRLQGDKSESMSFIGALIPTLLTV